MSTTGESQMSTAPVFTRCRFELAPPRNFLYPGILLLLVEEPRHGYSLVTSLNTLGFGEIDRPSVYRALGLLERDGLVESWTAAPQAGPSRRVYGLTEQGEHTLRGWMAIVADTRELLGDVLRRYTVARGPVGPSMIED